MILILQINCLNLKISGLDDERRPVTNNVMCNSENDCYKTICDTSQEPKVVFIFVQLNNTNCNNIHNSSIADNGPYLIFGVTKNMYTVPYAANTCSGLDTCFKPICEIKINFAETMYVLILPLSISNPWPCINATSS